MGIFPLLKLLNYFQLEIGQLLSFKFFCLFACLLDMGLFEQFSAPVLRNGFSNFMM